VMERAAIVGLIRGILKSHNYGMALPDSFDAEDSLFAKGIIDSFGILAFINELQSKFDLKVDTHEIHPGNFETIEKIATLVYNKRRDRND
jgi:acyl carrier protein